MSNDFASPFPVPRDTRLIFAARAYLIRHGRLLVIVSLFVAALGIRLYHINQPPLHFHATRQYRGLLIARSYYFDSQASAPGWMKNIATISRQRQGMLEPPIVAFLVSLGYRLAGGEHFWIPQLLSSIFWLIGGSFLYLIAARIAGSGAALFATAYYLFLPFGVVASRSFQPDPLMVMLLLASVFAILRFYENPSSSRLGIAAGTAALAFLVKPACLFAIAGAFVAAGISQHGVRRAILGRDSRAFLAVMLLPTLVIYLYGIWTGTFLVGEAEKTLLPQLWLSRFFWRGWVENIGATVGFIPFIGALLGVVLLRGGLPIALGIGLWLGYVVFGLVFNYNLATHDYYQLQLIPIVALSTGPVVALLMSELGQRRPQRHWRVASWGTLLLALVGSIGVAGSRLENRGVERQVRSRQEIGEQVQHSSQTIFLAADYGVPLEYHGLLSGSAWPLASDLEWERLAGVPVVDAEERFRSWFAKDSPEYFIVEDLREFEQQPDLKRFLTDRFPIVAQTDDYVVFKLKAS